MKTIELREVFLDFFQKQGHQIVSSSSLIPSNDPSLLFTNAGMVQFKDLFLGHEQRAYRRAASVQRCLRAGGKHNDLDNVGYTARHHTFFEMLGSFSFGDYFKREAIHYAWTFLTEILKLPVDRLWITIHHEDDEAADIWLKEVQISPERFSRLGDEDNFWSMGETGPCGPCSEIFYDHGPEIFGGPPGFPHADGDRYIEIWNLVFMQYNRDAAGILHPLPNPSVDTGMGFERIAAVLQGVHSNYQIDSFVLLIDAIKDLAQTEETSAAVQVIADHIRASAFLIADGIIPGNEGRAYVLRRIIRRAARHAHGLNIPLPFMAQLVAPLILAMGSFYPDLVSKQALIEKILTKEEEQFSQTLSRGLALLQEELNTLTTKEIRGDLAFKLYDTYGFPLDLTTDIAREQGLSVDLLGFEEAMQVQRKQSQAASQFSGEKHVAHAWVEISNFHGYHVDVYETEILSIVAEGSSQKKLKMPAMQAALVLADTPFYAESGGQVGDQGWIKSSTASFKVTDTQSYGKTIVHYGQLMEGSFAVGDSVKAEIDRARRQGIRLNHSATHLLHAALRTVLGSQLQQKGSLVDYDRARFDFSHHQGLSQHEWIAVEQMVNAAIRANIPVETLVMTSEEAKRSGALALFEEKYGDTVRVLSMGTVSKELCGGTHVQRTGDIGLFKIQKEYGVAAGVRRVEFLTGEPALTWVDAAWSVLNDLSLMLKTTPDQVSIKLTEVLNEFKKTQLQAEELQRLKLNQLAASLVPQAQIFAKFHLLIKGFEGIEPKNLRVILDEIRLKIDSSVVVLYSVISGKISVVASVSPELIGSVPSAVDLVKMLCGQGGGRDEMAQGGAPVPSHLKENLAHIYRVFDSKH